MGLLPAGVHEASWDDVMARFGSTERRQVLLAGLFDALRALGAAGCSRFWLDGSFVSAIEEPGDYDACWDWSGVEPALLDPLLLDFSQTGRALMKAKYLGDLFLSGIEAGSGKPFVEFFQRTRDGQVKGIVLLNPKEVA